MVDHNLIVNCILLILSFGLLIASSFAIEQYHSGGDKPLGAACTALIFAFIQMVVCSVAIAQVMVKLAWYILLSFCCVAYIVAFALMIECCKGGGGGKAGQVVTAFLSMTGINFIAIAICITAVAIVEEGNCC